MAERRSSFLNSEGSPRQKKLSSKSEFVVIVRSIVWVKHIGTGTKPAATPMTKTTRSPNSKSHRIQLISRKVLAQFSFSLLWPRGRRAEMRILQLAITFHLEFFHLLNY
jgi:hypothetical protein